MLKKIFLLILFLNSPASYTTGESFTIDSGEGIAQLSMQKEIDATTAELSKTIRNSTSETSIESVKNLENQLGETGKQLSNLVYSAIFFSMLLGAWLFEQIRSSVAKPCYHHDHLEKF